jgi:cytochrome subunit of sulfide dehydrogenase
VRRAERLVIARVILLAIAFLALVPATEAASPTPPPGATSCSGCHPASKAVATPVPQLIGRTSAEILAAVQAFRSGQKAASVMDRIAKGFSDDEIKAIAAWYAAQKD